MPTPETDDLVPTVGSSVFSAALRHDTRDRIHRYADSSEMLVRTECRVPRRRHPGGTSAFVRAAHPAAAWVCGNDRPSELCRPARPAAPRAARVGCRTWPIGFGAARA